MQELGQGMILAVCQLNLPNRTASGPRDYRQTKQHIRKVLHVFTAGWFRFQIMTWEPDHEDRTRAQKPENQAGPARGRI